MTPGYVCGHCYERVRLPVTTETAPCPECKIGTMSAVDDIDVPLWPWEKIDGPPPSILSVNSIGTQIIGGNMGSVAVYGGSATITNNKFRDPTALHLGWGANVNASSNDHTPPRPRQDEPPPGRNRAQRRAADKKARRKRDD